MQEVGDLKFKNDAGDFLVAFPSGEGINARNPPVVLFLAVDWGFVAGCVFLWLAAGRAQATGALR